MTHASTILIVDDNASARATLEALLTSQGYQLAFAASGAEALQKAADLTPDLILLDVMMPGMEGFEVCRRLRANPLLAEVPIILITALDDRASRLRGIEAGADDFVSKPFDRAELRARVQTILRLDRYRRLLAERAKFEWVVRQASDGYLMVDTSDHVQYANPKARLYLGLPEDDTEPVFGTFLELARQQYNTEPQETWASWPVDTGAAYVPAQSPRYLVRPESPIAQVFWLQVGLLDLPSGLNVGRLIHLHDVTAQIILRRGIWGFQTAINHKLRTPLAILTNSLDLLAHYRSDLSSDELANVSEMALEGVTRLRSHIGDILQYLDAPTLAQRGYSFELARLPQLVAEIGSHLGLEAVSVSVHENLADEAIVLSERAIELALWEILENTKKFHPGQAPHVSVVASCLESHKASLQISDDGLTLSPEQLVQAWTPYYQGEKHFTGQVHGMGLGLSTVAVLVWGVGGTCRMYNRPQGPGVVVELVLPLAKDELP